MAKGNEDKAIGRVVKALKIGGGLLFFALNAYIFYRYSTAYQDGEQRGQILQREKDQRKKQGKQKPHKPVLPEENQPEYIERQVRKYKMAIAAEKQSLSQPTQQQK